MPHSLVPCNINPQEGVFVVFIHKQILYIFNRKCHWVKISQFTFSLGRNVSRTSHGWTFCQDISCMLIS
jgi:hypothetical protein